MSREKSTEKPRGIIESLVEAGWEEPLQVEELPLAWFEAHRAELEEAFLEVGRHWLPVTSSLLETLHQWCEVAGLEGSRKHARQELLDYLSAARRGEALSGGAGLALYVDGVVRLVEQLSEELPAVLAMGRTEEMAEPDREAIKAVIAHYATDPLREMVPGISSTQGPGIVLLDSGLGPQQGVRRLRCDAELQEEVRSFLSEERVLRRLVSVTGGDRQRLEAMLATMAESPQDLWRARYERLDGGARALLGVLAVAGEPLELGFLQEMEGTGVLGTLRELINQGLLARQVRRGQAEVEFSQPEMRAGVLASLTREVRREIHAALAATSMGYGQGDAVFLARHALLAGEREIGVQFGLPAAERLFRAGRWAEAEALLGQLRSALKEVPEAVVELDLRIAEAQGQWLRALRYAGELKKYRPEPAARGRLECRIGGLLAEIGQQERARERFLRAEELLKGREESRELWLARLGLADLEYQRGDLEGAVARAEAILARVEEPVLELRARSILGRAALFGGELEKARRLFDRNVVEARDQGLELEEMRAEGNLAVVALQERRFEEAERRLHRALEGSRLPGGLPRTTCWLNLGILAQRRGDYATALEHYQKFLRDVRRQGNRSLSQLAQHNLATLFQDVGAFEAARELVEGGGFVGPWAQMVRAQVLVDEGRNEEAVGALVAAEEELAEVPRLYRVEMGLRQALILLEMGEIEGARVRLEGLRNEEMDASEEILFDYGVLLLGGSDGGGSSRRQWQRVIDGLEAVGHFRDAMAAGLYAARQVEDVAERRVQLEQAMESVRRRAQAVPSGFLEGFWKIPVYRDLRGALAEAKGERAPEEPRSGANKEAVELNAPVQDGAFRRWRRRYSEIIGEDKGLLETFSRIDRVAKSDMAVLITGESGTGKELVAGAIHRESSRGAKPFVKVNCAAFVEDLLLSELFGHEKGAFTGAVSTKSGRFERAAGGTILLDEIADISPKTQVALLRVLQDGVYERVGGAEPMQADVRILAATNRDLEGMVRSGEFRLDLYYRLKGFVVEMPALRERRGDVPHLLDHFARQYGGASAPVFTDEAVQFLARYGWPGNIRELQNFVQSVLLFTEGAEISMDEIGRLGAFFSGGIDEELPALHLAPKIAVVELVEEELLGEDPEGALVQEVLSEGLSLAEMKSRLELLCIERALRESDGNITQAAQMLQMKRPRLSQIINGTPELLALKEELVG